MTVNPKLLNSLQARLVGPYRGGRVVAVAGHPTDAMTFYFGACAGGVWKTTDGGTYWENVSDGFFETSAVGAIAVAASDGNVTYAGTGEACIRGNVSHGDGVYRSTDGGLTWTNVGLRDTRHIGRVRVHPRDPALVYVAALGRAWGPNRERGVFRSRDGGAHRDHVLLKSARAGDVDTVWVADYSLWKSTDGGKTFGEVATPHGDNHDLWIDPANHRRMIEGNDGGACVSFNSAQSWSTIYNQPTAQFYHVCADDQRPYRIYGSQQDNWAISLPSQSHRGVIAAIDWVQPGGGERGYIAVQPGDPNVLVGGSLGTGPGNGRLIHYDHRTGQERVISVWPEAYGMGTAPAEHRYRFQWTFPVFYSRWDARELWIAGNRVFRSLDDGQSWEIASPDLTRNDGAKLGLSGGPVTRDNTGAEVYCTIFALVESPHERDVLWAGTDDGLVHLSRDRGRTWQPVTPPDLPEWALISVLEPSPHDAATCYVAATCYKLDDTRPYLFKTSDYGRTWKRITNGLPEGEFTRVIREDPNRRGLLYCGTETKIWVSLDDGGSWQRLPANLPVAPIHDLIVKDTDLVVATHGRVPRSRRAHRPIGHQQRDVRRPKRRRAAADAQRGRQSLRVESAGARRDEAGGQQGSRRHDRLADGAAGAAGPLSGPSDRRR